MKFFRARWMPLLAVVGAALSGCVSAEVGGGVVGFASTSSECVDVSAVADSDIRKLAGPISAAGYCVSERRFKAGGRDWLVHEIDSGRRGPLHLLPHDDENAALPIAVYALGRLGGRAIVVEAGEARFFRGIDPNRYFSTGRSSASRCAGGAPDPAFAREMLRGAGSVIIAYHSNDNGYAGDGRGGSGTISVRRSTASLKPFKASGDEDNLVLLAGSTAEPGAAARRAIKTLNGAGVHALYEVVSEAWDDCSLSNHLVLEGGPRYFNIEVGHGNVAAGQAMVDALARVL